MIFSMTYFYLNWFCYFQIFKETSNRKIRNKSTREKKCMTWTGDNGGKNIKEILLILFFEQQECLITMKRSILRGNNI